MVVLLLGLGLTATSVAGLARARERLQGETLDGRTDAVRTAVTTETLRYVNALRDVSAAVGAQQDLTAADYSAITLPISRDRLSGATGISLVVPSTSDQIAALQRRWRGQGSTGLHLRPADTATGVHRFVVLSRSLDPQTTILGVDITESPESVEAMDLARSTGQVAASRTYVLLRDRNLPRDQQQLSFIMTIPVHAGVGAGAFRGWLVMGVRGRDFLGQALHRSTGGQVDVAVTDTSASGREIPVAAWPHEIKAARPDRETTIEVAQRQWRLSVHANDVLIDASRTYLIGVVGGAGVLVSVLLAGLVLVLATSRDRALAQVGQATSALYDDIARREQVEAELRRREAELSGFAGVVAHDLRSPLSIATGYVDLLTEDAAHLIDDTSRDQLQRVRTGLTRMTSLIDDLLGYATADHASVQHQPVDLHALATDILNERTTHLDHDHRPTVDLTALPTVTGDRGMLRQVLDNLISNAIKYTPHGKPARISIHATALADDQWVITIADRGIGIPAGQHDTIFEPFHRARGSEGYPGTGLGLAICRRIIERHHGTITAQLEPEGGTRFIITLPAAYTSPTTTPTPRSTSSNPV